MTQIVHVIINKNNKLYINDYFLIENNSTELNIVFHFSRYFIELDDQEFHTRNGKTESL